ncbi:CHASE3 domain-containing protein [Niabella hibiscisoli]|uniref:CHASE3 domain-containing protein n=1 Tax=Niabella hibiscisoli TaxID=1825928 RepID=UPI001F0FD9EB|nr:CHASE3 domain-containing protein [Niabella hibiscisoli]MCH5719680.1 CHASE3 domain-containing protein [Niabella hibiscisoli]
MSKKLIRKLQVGFGISLLILLLSSSASYISIKEQINSRTQVMHTQRTMRSANQILMDLQNAETGLRGFLLTGTYSFLDPYYQSVKSLPTALEKARNLVQDNPQQVERVDSIHVLVDSSLHLLERLIALKNEGTIIRVDQLVRGKQIMDACRTMIARFTDVESALLQVRNEKMHRSSNTTSIFIVAAALISIFITLYFYLQIREEFKKREQMQKALKQKDEDISKRLNIIQHIAQKISSGDFSVRVNDEEQDELGSIGVSLNTMAASLQESFDEINSNEWKQAGLVNLNEITTGNKSEQVIAKEALAHLVQYGDCLNGAIYLLDTGSLHLRSAYGLEDYMKQQYAPGEGIVGQVFNDRAMRQLTNLSETDFTVGTSAGAVKVHNLIWLPLLAKGQCFGVIELGAAHSFEEADLDFYQEAARIITLEILAAKARKQVQTLLEETQAQSEELQTQHSELENLNTELEAQTQKLQASEEELRVQQEELLQSNQELEERSRLLEEKNELIASRNLEVQKKQKNWH